jgi:hypothetical protein
MEIILQTLTTNPFLAFRGLERFLDGSGYLSQTVIRSGWLSVDYKFYFERSELQTFVGDLQQLDQTLVGQARLKPMGGTLLGVSGHRLGCNQS